MDELENTTEVQPWVIPVAIAVGVTAAAGLGYFLWRRKKKGETVVDYDEAQVDAIVAYAKKDLLQTEELIDELEYASPEPQMIPPLKLVETDVEINRATNPKTDYTAVPRVKPVISADAWANPPKLEDDEAVEELPVVQSVFQGKDETWDHEAELQQRKSDMPYIINVEEFIADDMGFKQITCTYYSGDNVLVDPYDTVIHQHEKVTGELKFGHGSKDNSLVYIRNEVEMIEYEVILYNGHYAIEVLGEQMAEAGDRELRHSHSVPRMRRE